MLYSQAEIIKHHREQKGLTQSQLAEGICSRFHIVKAEAGTRKLSDFVFRDVLLKLDLEPHDFNVGISTEDNDTIFYLQMEEALRIPDYSNSREHSKKIKDDIINYISVRKIEPANAKYWELLKLRADILINLPGVVTAYTDSDLFHPNVLKARECAIEAVKLFRPNFELEKINTYFLTLREYDLLKNMALTYGYAGELKKEVEITDKLITNIEMNHKNLADNHTLNSYYTALLGNNGTNYNLLEMWGECLETNSKCMNMFIKSANIMYYIGGLYSKAYALMKLGRTDEGRECWKKYFMLLYVFGESFTGINISTSKKDYESTFGETLDIGIDF